MNIKKVFLTKQEHICFQVAQGAVGVKFGIRVQDYNIPNDATVNVYITKPDGMLIYNAAELADNVITITTTSQMTVVYGLAVCQVQIVMDGVLLRTFVFDLRIEKSIIDSGAVESSDEFTALEEALQQVNDFVTKDSIKNKGSVNVPVWINGLGVPEPIEVLSVSHGGTGATTAAAARTVLNVPNLNDLKSVGDTDVPVFFDSSGKPAECTIPFALEQGGTGVTTLDDLKTLLGFASIFHTLSFTDVTNANSISGNGWGMISSAQITNIANLPYTSGGLWFFQFASGVYKVQLCTPSSVAEGNMVIKWRKGGSSSSWSTWRDL